MKEQEITFEDVVRCSSNGVLVTDRHGIIVYMNPEAERILGFSADRQTGRYVTEVLPLTGPVIMECLKTRRPRLGHQILGKKVDLVLNVTLIEKAGEVHGTVCNFQEMGAFEDTAKKLASYRHLNQQLETIFKASFDGIWVCDGTGKVISINEASERLNGIRAREVVGKNVQDLVRDGLFDRSVTLEVLESKKQVNLMQYIPRTRRFLLATGTPAFDENGEIYLVVVNERDMTDLNAMRRKLEQSHMAYQKMKDELTELSVLEFKRHGIVGESEPMRRILRAALKLARLEASNILILGESGTGKGLLAKFIHQNSERKHQPFIQINCAALPEHLLEAELFGYERGAFTGAREQGKAGLFELAHRGTLFLDEIGDLPLPLQAKLLKCLDDHEIMRLGATRPKRVDCLVIAATNRNLEDLVRRHRFRQDLFYRLNTFSLTIPPLRDRPEDILELARHFLNSFNVRYGMRKRLSEKGLRILEHYPFPGNVRELKNIMKRAVVMAEEEVLDGFLQDLIQVSTDAGAPVGMGRFQEEQRRWEENLFRRTMKRCRNTREMAAVLGISQATVVRKMKRHGLRFR